jgi:septal ring factor EnvC (AmiA/AmiB activator)
MSTRSVKKRKCSTLISANPLDKLDYLRGDVKDYFQELYETQHQEHQEIMETLQKLVKLVKKQDTEIQKLKNQIRELPYTSPQPAAPAPPVSVYRQSNPVFSGECSYIS